MPTIQVDTITDSAGTGAPDFPNGLTTTPLLTKSQVIVHTANGKGSTNTAITRFSTIQENTGSAITYADSAANGASFTIDEDGIYAISYTDASATAGSSHGISLNSSQLTTDIISINTADRTSMESSGTSNLVVNISVTLSLSNTDVIRPHNDPSSSDPSTAAIRKFVIIKIADL